MGTRVSYPVEVKMKAIETKLAGVSTKNILEQSNIRNKAPVQTQMKWYRNGNLHRLEQPVGKPYTVDKGPEYKNETASPR